ncbi:chalcone isomerase family protein, partial [Roseateles sp.]|uniref:chalcone isomerase family protein n=1 Tax=Roseateles sp. TaxID=1971397 RepID=UPI003922E0B7
MRRLLLLALLAASLGVSAETVEVGKVKFPTQVDVAGQRLVLSGAGIRTKAIFKVYAAALYLKAPATTTEAVLSQG